MSIVLYNSMSGEKEPLQTIEPGKVRFYACGPTVYNYFHLGNARMFVAFDTIRRYLEYRGYDVRFVQNFTDVDDRIIQRAHELGISPRELAKQNIADYFADAEMLFIRPATVHPRVTECIPEIIQFIEDLIRDGHAYERNGSVYFDTSSFPEYGKLSHQSPDDMRAFGLTSRTRRTIRLISPCGRRPNPVRSFGRVHGAQDVPGGTSSAQ
ncbi:hypothetical protein GCM10025858_15750 [Alicyclobacillus sacchari]|nr:hypothetical protein GCM10025858_15750 [Alicyclobacillus sacchari]